MTRIAIIICDRYSSCGGGKCFRALRERVGGFSRYPADEPIEVVGYASCGGCPGGNVEHLPEEFKRNGADVVHLATGLVVGYPPCPTILQFKQYIESRFALPVVVGTHPIPLKYLEAHRALPFWKETRMGTLASTLMAEPAEIMEAYN
jgi:predicted metal-binding protein